MSVEKNLRRMTDHKYRPAIVIIVSFGIGLVTLLPLADEYEDLKQRSSDAETALAEARFVAQDLESFQRRVQSQVAQLEKLEARAVSSQRVHEFRNRMVDMVRESGCQIRRIEVGTPTRRPWKENDAPLSEAIRPPGEGDTPFSLERRSVILAVDGSMSSIHDLLGQLEKEQTLAHPHRLQLQAVSTGGDSVTLELELWLFALSRTAA